MNIDEAVEFVNFWYNWGTYKTPTIVSGNKSSLLKFVSFASKSASFIYEISLIEEKAQIIVNSDCDSAFVDMQTNEVNLSAKLFDKSFIEKSLLVELTDDEFSKISLTLINGCIIHEASHILHTPKNFNFAIKYNEGFKELIKYFSIETIFTTFNIFEDIYIDHNVSPKHKKWLELTIDFFIPQSKINDIVDVSFESCMNLALLFKNEKVRYSEKFNLLPGNCFNILKQTLSSKEKRLNRIKQSFNFLEELIVALDIPERDEIEIKKDLKKCESLEDNAKTYSPGKFIEGELSEEISEKLVCEINGKISSELSIKANEFVAIDGCSCNWNDIKEFDVYESKKCPDNEIVINSDFDSSFVKKLIALRTTKRSPGRARTNGSTIVKNRLSRIATDCKIFSKKDSERVDLKELEVIILIDMSGSTLNLTEDGDKIIEKEFSASKEIFKSLREARIPCSVYGHTSCNICDSDTPSLIHIASYNMKITNIDIDKRFESITKELYLRENYDGVAIDKVSEKFTNKNNTKYLIVLSDGKPAGGHRYRGNAAIEHTKAVINKLRTNKNFVFSISVVREVIKENNLIYGKEFNIDGTNIDVEFKKLIDKIVA